MQVSLYSVSFVRRLSKANSVGIVTFLWVCLNTYFLVEWRHLTSISPRVMNTGSIVEAAVFPKATISRSDATDLRVVNSKAYEICEFG